MKPIIFSSEDIKLIRSGADAWDDNPFVWVIDFIKKEDNK